MASDVEKALAQVTSARPKRESADAVMLERFITRLKKSPKTSHKMLALGELRRIHSRRWPDGKPYAPTTNRSLISKYRAAIADEFGTRAPALETMKYSRPRVDAYKQAAAEQRNERLSNQRPLRLHGRNGLIDNAVTVLEFVDTVRWDTASAVAAVVALTGRRPFEVACTGNFKPGTQPGMLQFSGQAKTRDENRAAQAYQIPVLAASDLTLEVVAKIRELIDPDLDNRTYSQRWGRAIGVAARSYFRDADGRPILPRELREAYAAAAAHLYKPDNMADLVYANQVLGHKPLDLETTTYYFDFYVTDPKPKKAPPKKAPPKKAPAKKAPAKKAPAKKAMR